MANKRLQPVNPGDILLHDFMRLLRRRCVTGRLKGRRPNLFRPLVFRDSAIPSMLPQSPPCCCDWASLSDVMREFVSETGWLHGPQAALGQLRPLSFQKRTLRPLRFVVEVTFV
jgi:hypothetical protein